MRRRQGLIIGIAIALITASAGLYAVRSHSAAVQVAQSVIPPRFVTPVGADGSQTNVDVGFPWTEQGYCAGQFHVTATETPTEVRVGDVVSRTQAGAACAGLGSNGRWATVPLSLRTPIGNRLVVRAGDGAALPVFALTVNLHCQDLIASAAAPEADRIVMFKKVALPKKALQANVSGESDPNAKWFAKVGLFVSSGATFMLRLPEEWMGRASIGWGSPATRTTSLYVSGCVSEARWLVFAGGFWVAEPTCLPLIVNSANEERTVMIGVGKACPGQAEPPPPI